MQITSTLVLMGAVECPVCACVRTFVTVLRMRSVEVIDGVDRVQLDLRQVFVADSVKLRRALRRGRPRHRHTTAFHTFRRIRYRFQHLRLPLLFSDFDLIRRFLIDHL